VEAAALAIPKPVAKAKKEFPTALNAGCELIRCPEDESTDLDVILEADVVTGFCFVVVRSRLTGASGFDTGAA